MQYQQTALHYAAQRPTAEMVDLLLGNKADVNAKTKVTPGSGWWVGGWGLSVR